MICPSTEQRVLLWQAKHGGHRGRPAAHALKTLGEMVELCFAAGATLEEVCETFTKSLDKEYVNGTITHEFDEEKVNEETADVLVCMIAFTGNNHMNPDLITNKKMDVLEQREWVVDKDGVLRRPGRTHT